MKKVNIYTKASIYIVMAAIVVIVISYFAIPLLFPIGWGAFLWLVPPVFGIPGVITAIIGVKRNKTILAFALVIINIVFILWFMGFWPIGSLLSILLGDL